MLRRPAALPRSSLACALHRLPVAPTICMLHCMFPFMFVTTVPRSAGFVMSMYSLLRSKPEAPSEEDIEEALAGNLWCADKIVSIFENPK